MQVIMLLAHASINIIFIILCYIACIQWVLIVSGNLFSNQLYFPTDTRPFFSKTLPLVIVVQVQKVLWKTKHGTISLTELD